jgi:hypothetical protein
MKKVLIVVPCSDRKSGFTPSSLKASSLECGSIEQVAQEWLDRVGDATPTNYIDELYAGRSFSELRKARKIIGADLIVISAGLGIVSSAEKIPNYALTVSNGTKDSVGSKITSNNFSPSTWWNALKVSNISKYNLRQKLETVDAGLILIGLSKNYAKMVADDLRQLNKEILEKCRVFGVGLQGFLPDNLSGNLLEYDQRFNGRDSYLPGTMTDLVARCIHDFCKCLHDHHHLGKNLRADQLFVQDRLSDWRYPVIPKRKALTDEEVIKFILEHWGRTQGKTGETLKLLRDEGNACEQGRFGALIASVRDQGSGQEEFNL